MNVTELLQSVARDLRYALRALPRRPAFTLPAVLTLAMGIGATTAIFSVVYSVVIKPLPYPNADELVRIRHSAPGINVADLRAGASMYVTYREENRTFASIGAWREDSATLLDRGEPERVRALRVMPDTLQTLGVQPLSGRAFTAQEHGPDAEGPAPVILSHAFWQRRFGGDDAALARELSIDALPARVVGIMPPGFRFLDMTPQPDVILAERIFPTALHIGTFSHEILARLAPGVAPAEAGADVERMLPIWLNAWPVLPGAALSRDAFANMRIAPTVRPLKDDVVGSVSGMLWVLMGAIGAVLVVACANIANLMLVRSDARRQEFAVRAALGARPARIARELLVESFTLGAAGSVLGLVLAYVGLRALVAIGPSNLPRLEEISLHLPVLAFAAAVTLASTVMFGSIAALKVALRIDTPMMDTARGSSSSRERSTTRSALVVVQVALALVLVVSAALMIRTFQALRDVDPGFSEPATIQTARIWVPANMLRDPEQYTRVQQEILGRIEALPGVVSAGFGSAVPMEGPRGDGPPVVVEGQPLPAGESPSSRRYKFISPGYLAAMGTRVIAGREMTWRDIETGGRVALISEDFARELAAEPADALGKRIGLPLGPQDTWREVIGVVQGVRQDGLYEAPPSTVYWPVLMEQFGVSPLNGTAVVTFAIRSERAGTASLTNEVRQAIRSVNGDIPVALEGTMQDLYGDSLARTSFTLVMLAIAGAMALVLGVVGIYGVIAYVVAQRAREIGIRSALGAEPGRLKRMFLLHGLRLATVGVAVGLVASVVLGRSMSSLLFGISPVDPAAYAMAIAVITAAATLATYLPARRAAAVDPMQTLRSE